VDGPALFSALSPSSSTTLSISSMASILQTGSWVDVLDIDELDIFGAINSSIGSMGCVTMINYEELQRLKINDIVQNLLQDPSSKQILETKVPPSLLPY
jgi:hypothetical protein